MHVDLGSSESIRDPAGYFREARQRAGPVQWSDVHRAWVVLPTVPSIRVSLLAIGASAPGRIGGGARS